MGQIALYGHIHAGNIAIENQRVLLLDIENVLVGVPCVYRPYLLELKRTHTAEAVDVYCFGRTLYEMAYADTLETCSLDRFSEGVSNELESVLHLCLSSTSCKHGSTTIDDLLHHRFFTRATLNGLTPHSDERGHLKIPLGVKEQIRQVIIGTETRLKNDQKLRKRESVWRSMSSLAETVRSHSSVPSTPTPLERCASEASPQPACNVTSAGRGALLHAICSFDKSRLARIESR
ncbi:unnamed protein product [Leptidea sinapis]|uniref:Protein kinase domain-containing protein n=1 Tax=Leptidea sinapis TaxID=189913 RepID=A0A5E4QTY1_9NEOP|nr:unnamed protein product [Leptidea sinapis]